MNKLKTGLVLLLTVVILLTGAFLPKIVSVIQDHSRNGRTSSAPIANIELKIEKDVSPVAQLIMLCNSDSTTEVTENIAAMTKEEAMAAVRAGLVPYIDAGLIEYCEDTASLSPFLVQASAMQDLQGIFWFIHIMGDAGGISNINIIMDDETGNILHMEYTYENLTNVIQAQEALDTWSDIFFSALEIDYQRARIEAEYVYDDSGYAGHRYAFSDPEYGQIFVDLFLYPYGFSMESSPM